jgi:uncharacterized protein YukE
LRYTIQNTDPETWKELARSTLAFQGQIQTTKPKQAAAPKVAVDDSKGQIPQNPNIGLKLRALGKHKDVIPKSLEGLLGMAMEANPPDFVTQLVNVIEDIIGRVSSDGTVVTTKGNFSAVVTDEGAYKKLLTYAANPDSKLVAPFDDILKSIVEGTKEGPPRQRTTQFLSMIALVSELDLLIKNAGSATQGFDDWFAKLEENKAVLESFVVQLRNSVSIGVSTGSLTGAPQRTLKELAKKEWSVVYQFINLYSATDTKLNIGVGEKTVQMSLFERAVCTFGREPTKPKRGEPNPEPTERERIASLPDAPKEDPTLTDLEKELTAKRNALDKVQGGDVAERFSQVFARSKADLDQLLSRVGSIRERLEQITGETFKQDKWDTFKALWDRTMVRFRTVAKWTPAQCSTQPTS